MRKVIEIAIGALSLASPAWADPIMFAPEGCDFQIGFPAAPTVTQSKSDLNRGDAVITNRAVLRSTADGKSDFLRAECTRIPSMGFVDEAILKDNMTELAASYKLQNPLVTILRKRRPARWGVFMPRPIWAGRILRLKFIATPATPIFSMCGSARRRRLFPAQPTAPSRKASRSRAWSCRSGCGRISFRQRSAAGKCELHLLMDFETLLLPARQNALRSLRFHLPTSTHSFAV